MKIVYVAGPYRATTAWGVESNIQEARAVGAMVATLGAMPLIPHANTAHFDGIQDAEFWIDGTLELARRCDAMVVFGKWETSEGTRGEIAEFERLGKPVFYHVADVHDWLKR